MESQRWTIFGLEWPILLAGSAIFGAGMLTRGFLSSTKRGHIIQSPRTRLLPKLSQDQFGKLPYPPDALPGARDVASPYGSIRVYEWGPEAGRKALLIHGISTPCLALAPVAHELVANGCRVMLFDLFGRGYSDTAIDLPQDIRLFTTQILLALASSPLSWTGDASGGFALLGYSLGGGISAAFASHFPYLVNSLVLIAPAGLIRPHHFSRMNRIIYSEGVIPEPILHRAVRKRLQKPLAPSARKETAPEKSDVVAPVKAEMNLEANPAVVLSKSHPDITIEAAVNHQVLNHEGFVHAFMSSIRNGPISEQHQYWETIGERLQAQKTSDSSEKLPMLNGKVLIIGGAHDPLIRADELEADATKVLQDNVVFIFVDAGHEAPVMKGEEVARHIIEFWG